MVGDVDDVGAKLRDLCFKESRPKAVHAGEDLCNMEFSLGYGAMMLLTNTRLHMKRGKRSPPARWPPARCALGPPPRRWPAARGGQR